MGEQQKLNEFEPATYDAWLKLVERDLKGAPFEKKLVKRVAGIEVPPLYTRAREAGEQGPSAEDPAGLPGCPPYTRGCYALGAAEMGWDVRVELGSGDPAGAADTISEYLGGGATSVSLVLDRAARAGSNEHGLEGVAIENLAELDIVLRHVALEKVPVALEAGATALPLAAGLVALARRRKVRLEALSGTFGIDPLTTLATFGALPTALETALADAVEAARWASRNAPRLQALMVDTTPYQDAGADAVFEVALALAAGLEYLRALTRGGLSIDEASAQIQFRYGIGRDFFSEMAKLRAARRTWARVVEACGGSADAQRSVVWARSANRTKTQRDPWVNLLRGTAESFSAVVGGADAITTLGFDAAYGESDEFSQRMARNTQHLLRHESNLHRVIDPAGGSYYLESLTDGLAQRAWEKFQAIERSGGLARVILEGSVQQELSNFLENVRKAVETRYLSITGVNEFPNVREAPLERSTAATDAVRDRAEQAAERSSEGLARLSTEPDKRFESAIESADKGAAFSALRVALGAGTAARCRPLARERVAQPFEALRDRADLLTARSGQRPSVFLANLGPIPEHTARAGYAQNFFEAGGLLALTNDGFATVQEAAEAFAKSGAQLAALCSSDGIYAELAEATATALRDRGARAIILAGHPGGREADYRTAGVTDFIYVGTNAVECLRSLLERAGAQ